MQKFVSTISRKIFLPIIVLALGAFGFIVFTACSDDSMNESMLINRGYKVVVTYDFQGGKVADAETITVRVKENSRIPEPSSTGSGVGIPSKPGYSLRGFYFARIDEGGLPVTDADGNVIPSDIECDFDTFKVSDTNITICAKWWDNYKVDLHYGNNYEKTERINLSRSRDGQPIGLTSTALSVRNYTFISYNLIKNGDESTRIKEFPYKMTSEQFEQSDDRLTADIWGESIDGVYQLIRTEKDFTLASAKADTNYYLLNDIDLKNAEYDDADTSNTSKLPKSYNGKFVGNGHKISNFTVKMMPLDRTYGNFGLFRALDSNAEISDVTFEGVTVSFDISNTEIQHYNLGMLAGQMYSGAAVKNVNISGTFVYQTAIGIEDNSLSLSQDLLIGYKSDDAVIENSRVVQVQKILPETVFTQDGQYRVNILYTDDGSGGFTVSDIYLFAEKRTTSGYSNKRIYGIEKNAENNFTVSVRDGRDLKDYDMVFNVSGNGEFSVTVSE